MRAGADGGRRREDPAALRRTRWPSTPTPAATTSRSPGTCARSRRWACPTTGRSTASCAPSPAASRSGWCWSTCSPARTRCCCSTSPTTSSTSPARSGSSTGSGSRTRPSCSSATTASCSTTPRPASSPSSSAPPATRVWTHPGGFSSYHEARKDRFLRFEELRRRWDEEHAKLKALVLRYKHQGGVQRRAGLAVPGRADPAAQVRGGRPADRAAARAAGEDAAQGRPHRQARGGLRGPRAHRPDAAVRPRGLVRRAGRRPRLQRLRQVPLPAAARRRRQRPRRRAPAGRRRPRSSRSTTPARPSWVPGCAPAGSCRPTSTPSWSAARCWRSCTAATQHRDGMGREQAARVLDRYELAHASEQKFESPQRRPAGPVPDPDARAVRGDAAAARRADRQPRRPVRRGARGGARGVRGHRARGDPRPLVRPRLRPVPRLRRGRRGLRVRRSGLGRGPGPADRYGAAARSCWCRRPTRASAWS